MTTFLVVSNIVAAGVGIGAVWRLRRLLERATADRDDKPEFDRLTGMPDRAGVERAVGAAVARGRRRGGTAGIVAIDLLGFAALNESLGRRAGDDVVREVGHRLRGTARAEEVLGRVGADSFALVLEAPVTGYGAVRAATRLLGVLKEPIVLGEELIAVRAHAGVAVGGEPEELLDDAETALARASSAASPVPVVFEPSMRGEATERFRIEQQLATAVAHDELTVVYQPIHRTGSLGLVGFEALVRWTNERLGPVPPGRFIPVAESTGRIVEIGGWVLRRACGDMAELMRSTDRDDLVLSVNVSVHQLAFDGFVDTVAAALAATRVPAANLQLEITESMLAEPEQIGPALHSLRRLGVRLALDDVGTGYSSLAQIASLPIDAVKIDRSLVVAADDDGGIGKVLASVADLGRSLHLDVIAEGVETTGQLTVAVRSGCSFVQGFLLARPMAFTELVSYTSEGVARRTTAR